PTNFPPQGGLEDLVVGEARRPRDPRLVDAEQRRDLAAIARVREITPSEEVRGVAEEARAHRVALSGDGVRSGPRAPDISGHEREGDDRLRGAHALVALVHAHRPPEAHALAVANQLGELEDARRGKAGLLAAALERILLNVRSEFLEAAGVRLDV